jgi:acetyltransferase
MSHTLNEGGLEVPRFSDRLQAAIKEVIPPHGSAGNPVDLTFHMDAEILSTTVPEKVLNSGEVDGIVMHGLMSAGFLRAVFPHVKALLGFDDEELFISQFSRDLTGPVALPRKYGVPMILSSFFGREDNYTKGFQDNDTPVFDGPEKAARAMLALYRYSLVQQRAEHCPISLPEPAAEAAAIIAEAVGKGQTTLDEYISKKILSAYGAPVGSEALARSVEEAIEAAEKIGYPVVVKGCSPEFAHKTGHGLIHLNLQSAEEVRRACTAVVEAAGQEIPVLVAKMIKGERELMAGVTGHPAFGPSVMFGLGGIFAEALQGQGFQASPPHHGRL